MDENLKQAIGHVVVVATTTFSVAVFGYIGLKLAQKVYGPIEVRFK